MDEIRCLGLSLEIFRICSRKYKYYESNSNRIAYAALQENTCICLNLKLYYRVHVFGYAEQL